MNQPSMYTFPSPFGSLKALASDHHLLRLEFFEPSSITPILPPLIESLRQEIDLYAKGLLKKFSTPTRLFGTPFQVEVWEALEAIPYGETRSYAEIANEIGRETAHRAVANANGANPIPILIPCHRVIYADGSLGGYSGGLHHKERLLTIEGVL